MFTRTVALLRTVALPASSSLACLASVMAQGAAYDTTVVHVEALEEGAMKREDVRIRHNPLAENACVLEWRDNVLPLPVPAHRVALGRLGPDRLAVLAAGVREPLAVYVLEGGGAIARLATDGGLRLPPAFNGEGSWPLAIGREVFVVAFEKDLRVELRAFGFGDKVFAARTFPAGVSGFDVSIDERLQRISIQPRGIAGLAPLEFVHPLAPRIEFVDAVLDFGSVPVGASRRVRARLRNPTSDAIDVQVRVEGEFRLDTAQVRVGPAATAEVVVEFVPGAVREHRGQLLASHPGLERSLVLPLRGAGVRAAAAAEATLDVTRTELQVTPTEAVSTSRPWSAPSPDADATAGDGRVAAAPRVPAPPTLVPTPVAPRLEQEGDRIVVRGRPGELVLLAAVTLRTSGAVARPEIPLATWRLRLSATEGEQRLSLDDLGLRSGLGLIVVRRAGRHLIDSPVLTPDLRGRQSGN
ncbi:MAG: hypothetical protein R3F56_12235 [Planctomycetota bacterium]